MAKTKWCVRLKGLDVSCHRTKKAAQQAARKLRNSTRPMHVPGLQPPIPSQALLRTARIAKKG